MVSRACYIRTGTLMSTPEETQESGVSSDGHIHGGKVGMSSVGIVPETGSVHGVLRMLHQNRPKVTQLRRDVPAAVQCMGRLWRAACLRPDIDRDLLCGVWRH
eukprot:TRINITY_DN49805_c0_g1_i1.p1 TRINITY_DN49805_c0_g1~~TRINITY_DN49805_c0_g1_i1.p1  ORF type:complete len:103 (-),score=10.08 TRINITY_DN49805_c0_g1_i1:213-521(-)